MKKVLFPLVAGCIFCLASINEAPAQNAVNLEKNVNEKNDVKKTIIPANKEASDLGDISPKALKNFAKTYKNISTERWDKIDNGFIAKFILNDVINRVFYYPNGRWAGTLKSYSEDKMPAEVRKIVKREYYDYSIIYVQEAETFESDGIPTYFVHLEDKSSIKLIRIYDGEMEILKQYVKP